MDALTQGILAVSRWVLPILAIWILLRCVRSMLQESYEPELWARLEFSDGTWADVRHWECIIGRGRGCDIVIPSEHVERTHAALIRSDRGQWRLYDLNSEGGTAKGALRDEGDGLELTDGDIVFFADVGAVFHPLDEEQLLENCGHRSVPGQFISPAVSLLALTVFQTLLALQHSALSGQDNAVSIALSFAVLCLI